MPRINKLGIFRNDPLPFEVLDNATISSGALNFRLGYHSNRRDENNPSTSSKTIKEGDFVVFLPWWAVTGVRKRLNPLDLYWVNIGTTVSSDFLDNINSGRVGLRNDDFYESQITRELSYSMDFLNGEKSIQIELRANSISGPLLCTSDKIIVVDRDGVTGVPTYSLILDKNVATEGDTVKVTLITTNIKDGEKFSIFPWWLSGEPRPTSWRDRDFDPLFVPTVTVVNNSAEVTFVVKRYGGIFENDKTYEFHVQEYGSDLYVLASSEILTLRK
jgi:hypothetical protein